MHQRCFEGCHLVPSLIEFRFISEFRAHISRLRFAKEDPVTSFRLRAGIQERADFLGSRLCGSDVVPNKGKRLD